MEASKQASRPRSTPAHPLVISIELNPTQITATLVDERARIIATRQAVTPARTTRAASTIAQLLLELAASSERAASAIPAIGLSVPGVVDPPTERISVAGLKGWTRVALRPLIEAALAASGHDVRTPVHQRRMRAALSASPHPAMTINTRAATLAAAESWVGAARGKQHVVYVALGQEIEAGILVAGKVLAGAGGVAGAAGWLAVADNFKPEYERQGCLTSEVGSAALAARVMESWTSRRTSALGNLDARAMSSLTPATILRAARGGDPLASAVVKQTCQWLGRGLANLVTILNPEVIVLGGEMGLMLKPFLDEVRTETQRWTTPPAANQCRILSAALSANAELLGAARLAWLKIQPLS